MDDFLVFADDKAALHGARDAIAARLAGLRLRLHPRKTRVLPVAEGVDFVGFRIRPDRTRVRSASARRVRRRLRRLEWAYAAGDVGPAEVRQSWASTVGHLGHVPSLRLRERLLEGVVFRREA